MNSTTPIVEEVQNVREVRNDLDRDLEEPNYEELLLEELVQRQLLREWEDCQ